MIECDTYFISHHVCVILLREIHRSSLSGSFITDSDGAAALVLVSGEKALQLGLQVIARIKGYADAAQVL